MNAEQLCAAAVDAMQRAYAPYSKFQVGAALETVDGTVYTGCNIENGAYSPSVCAERVALFRAVHDGHRSFRRLAVAGGTGGVVHGACPPCGVCRQTLSEFCGPELTVYIVTGPGAHRTTTLGALLPEAFALTR